ncbi:MarR family winged helix-turn-helix transcriptional regulator [Mycolicibacterium nivoides]|uniref:MarR family winged helix-turn-helix transcriptional regulator n=1 Tax=Mycolicibacterium nivoides TaxID=2487344 RepID=UPI0008C6A963|nr:MarR family transcriptional regulator [Mycolicibacterium nivoides]SER52640.1 DNA-binding transcriptional regulator, MarR family [Mycobacterium sp. 88mf]SFG29510.1 DNA-binding transcriptional regulator, MarR family [Mycobacterium sp. 455mf]
MLAVESPNSRGVLNATDEEWRHWGNFGESAELLYREINAALVARHSLAVPDVQLLNLLNENARRRVRMGALADALVLAPSRLTWQVRRLEERGLVRRFRSREDGRGVVVGITRHGQECLRPAMRTYAMLVRQFYLAPLNREQMTALGDGARRVSHALKSGCAATH